MHVFLSHSATRIVLKYLSHTMLKSAHTYTLLHGYNNPPSFYNEHAIKIDFKMHQVIIQQQSLY